MRLNNIMKYKDVEDMPIWEEAVVLAKEINVIADSGKFAHNFGLKDQVRRATISIGSNIAEGFESCGNKEFIRFLYYAKRSSTEVRTQLRIAKDLEYINDRQYIHYRNRCKALAISIGKFISYLKKHQEKQPKIQ